MAVQRAGRDADLGGDVLHGDAVVAVAAEQHGGGGDDERPAVARPGADGTAGRRRFARHPDTLSSEPGVTESDAATP
jgi:hypothetical protein